MNYPRVISGIGKVLLGLVLVGGLLGALAIGAAYLYFAPELPSVATLSDVRLQEPLKVYTSGGQLIGRFGAKRRAPLDYDQIPPQMVHAFLAAEDDRFFEHPGVDYQGILRAVINLVLTGDKSQGGSTITMQVARNFYLTNDKTYVRKIKEIFLALEIDARFSKQEILELYLNKIYLGEGAYGVGAAAQIYYGKEPTELSLAQIAMIAGLPKAPSAINPVANPQRARARRDYVLRRMREVGFITEAQYQGALAEPVTSQIRFERNMLEAGYVAEMARRQVLDLVGEAAYTDGYTAITTIDAERQKAANRALRQALIAYSTRHGYRGPEKHIDLDAPIATAEEAARDAAAAVSRETRWKELLLGRPDAGPLAPALVVAVEDRSARVFTVDHGYLMLDWDALSWAKPYIGHNEVGPTPENAGDVVAPGDIVRVLATGDEEQAWRLAQIPQVSGALVSLDPHDGAIQALIGGFDFSLSKFNRATQALRQPGSSFKPFLYSAALGAGFTPASIINDAPVVYDDPALDDAWRPENYSERFYGPTRLRVGLIHSRNLVSIRLLRAIGIDYARRFISQFGIPMEHMPRDLSLALGTASVTPLQLARGYAVFANGGYLVEPYVLKKLIGPDGEPVYQANPAVACPLEGCEAEDNAGGINGGSLVTVPQADALQLAAATSVPERGSGIRPAKRVIPAQNAYLMTSMLQDVISQGTGRAALTLERSDLSGKTGTTDDQVDAWFSGFNNALVTSVWVGFDQPSPLGWGETGAQAALPMWIDYMGPALEGVPERSMPRPSGLVTVRIDPDTGKLAGANASDAIFETFRAGNVPEEMARPQDGPGDNGGGGSRGWVEKLY